MRLPTALCARILVALPFVIACHSGIRDVQGQIKLNDPLGTFGVVQSVDISPDGSRVVYRANQTLSSPVELFSVPIGGGTVTKLNDPFVPGGNFSSTPARISPDSSRVIYQADQDTDNIVELYSVPIDGGTVTKLNDPLPAGGDVEVIYSISPDSMNVVYGADQDTDNVFEVYSVPIGGGTVTKLNDPVVAAGNVFPVFPTSISSNSGRVIYEGEQDAVGVREVYSVPTGGGTVTKLNDPLVAGGNVSFGAFGGILLSPDASRVVYSADQDTDEVFELYSVPIGGGTVTKLNDPLVAGGDIDPFSGAFRISPDSTRVLYNADQDTDGVTEVYTVPIGGGTVTKLNGPLSPGGSAGATLISPDSSRVVYRSDEETAGVFELYSVPIAGGAATKLNDPLVAGGFTSTALVTPDSSRVVYSAAQDTAGVIELYSVPLTGGTVTKLNDPLVAGADIEQFLDNVKVTSDSSFVVYRTDQDTLGINELYTVPTDGGTVRKISHELAGVSFRFSVASDVPVVVFRANDPDSDANTDLFAAVLATDWAPAADGDWDTPTNWDAGLAPQSFTDVTINPETGLMVNGPAADTTVFTLDLGTTVSGTATLELQSAGRLSVEEGTILRAGGKLTGQGELNALGGIVNDSDLLLEEGGFALSGGTLTNNTTIRGDGQIGNALDNQAAAEVRTASGQRLLFTGTGNTNVGTIESLGGEIEFTEDLTNQASGQIIGRGAFRFGGAGLTNNGHVAFASAITDVFGDVTNDTSSASIGITVSGNSDAVFWDDVQNTSGLFEVFSGSSASFFGSFAGNGISGTGDVFFANDITPGASPGTQNFGGNVAYGPTAGLEIELEGVTPGSQFDQVNIAAAATLGGTLDVVLGGGFFPTPGETFEVMTFAARNGEFAATGDVGLLDPVTFLLPLYSGTNLLLFTAIPGDGSLDGTVNAGDYTLWANGFGAPDAAFQTGDYNGDGETNAADYTLWANNFGLMASAPALAEPVAPSSVPEPSTFAMLVIALITILGFARRRLGHDL